LSQAAENQLVGLDLETADFDYELPPHLIAQTPLARRDASRLLVLDKLSGETVHSSFDQLGDWLAPGDLLVANNSRVIPARLRGVRLPGQGSVEVLLLSRVGESWSALARPAKRLKPGTRLRFAPKRPSYDSADAIVEDNCGEGVIRIRFVRGADGQLEVYGDAPLPPYITQPLVDDERYQTVYARAPGSAAAPTAGLHFTDALIERLRGQGIDWAEVTLHVGLDTFRPVNEARVGDHPIHREWCEVSHATADAIAKCRKRGGRIVAVGTTAARTLETLGRAWNDADPQGFVGFTDVFIVPGHRWRLVDALVTNFHLPRSTLLMLVSALAGRETILEAYAEAIERGYRFYSFGDAMLIR
jgi:S-adenosylmethionine:tRNA ribosyltransferase-isomerase